MGEEAWVVSSSQRWIFACKRGFCTNVVCSGSRQEVYVQDLRDNRRFRRTTSPQGWTAVGHWVGIFVQVCLKPTSHSSDEQQRAG